MSLAELYSDAGRHDAVMELTNGLANESDAHAFLLVLRARALRENGMFDAAREALKEALRRRSLDTEIRRQAYLERANTYLLSGPPRAGPQGPGADPCRGRHLLRPPRCPHRPGPGVTCLEAPVNQPRSAKATAKDFPYTSSTVCYIAVADDGTVSWGAAREAYERALSGARLYAVWPGQWSSHLFVIDDIQELARALGIVHDPERTGLADHEHQVRWAVSPYERKPVGAYITIEVWLDCGCQIRDITAFAAQMRQQRRWDVATTSGWGGSNGRHYVRVRRKSLEK